jgi:hypothetical protein
MERRQGWGDNLTNMPLRPFTYQTNDAGQMLTQTEATGELYRQVPTEPHALQHYAYNAALTQTATTPPVQAPSPCARRTTRSTTACAAGFFDWGAGICAQFGGGA